VSVVDTKMFIVFYLQSFMTCDILSYSAALSFQVLHIYLKRLLT